MRLDEIKTALENATNHDKVLVVSGGLLGSDEITQLFVRYLERDSLTITGTEINSADGEIRISGNGSLFNLAVLPITLSLSLQNDIVRLTASLALPPNWKFSDSFPALQSPFFSDTQAVDSKLILTSSAHTDESSGMVLAAGLNFAGNAGISGPLTLLSPLLGSFNQFRLNGLISSINPTLIQLASSPLPNFKLGPIDLTGISLRFESQRPGAEPESSGQKEDEDEPQPVYPDDFVRVDVFIDSTVKIGSDVTVKLSSEIPLISDALFFRAEFDGIHLPSLNDLANLIGGADLIEPLPENFRNFGDAIELKAISFFIYLNPMKLLRVAVSVSVTQSYNLFPSSEILKAEGLDFNWFINDPTGVPQVNYDITGKLRINDSFDLILGLRADPDVNVYAELAPGSTVDLATIIQHFLPGLDFPSFIVESFSVNAKPKAKAYDLHSFLTGSWSFTPMLPEGIELTELEIDARFDGNAQPQSSGKISGLLIIGGVQITMTASKLSLPSGGWQLEGQTRPDEDIPFGTFLADLMEILGIHIKLPSSITELNIENLEVSFQTVTGDFTFTCEAKLPIEKQSLDVTVTGDLKKTAGVYTKSFNGHVTIGTLIFDLHFSEDNASSFFLSTYSHSSDQKKIGIKSLVENVSTTVASLIPDSLKIDLKDVLFAFSKTGDESNFLFGLDVGTSISLSNLPLVGQEFTADKTVSVDDLRLLVASKAFTQGEVDAFNSLIPKTVAGLSAGTQSNKTPSGGNGAPSADASAAVAIQEGITVSATMNFAGSKQVLSMPVASGAHVPANQQTTATTGSPKATTGSTPTTTTSTTTAVASSPSSDNSQWFDLQKTCGPVYFDKVGVQYREATLSFLLNAALTAAGLTISLDGLSVGSPLDHFAPKFDLHGIGIDYQNGPVEIGAAFLRTQAVAEDGTKYDEYDGSAVIKTAKFTLSALGSYTKLDGHPSLFIYAFLDYPLGGPAFFFVTGLSVGFGYNRKLIAPSIDNVADFPLVKQAVGGKASPDGLTGALQDLQRYIPPAIGEIFLAVGIKFNSFKLIDSFALLTVEFGSRFVANILGVSTAIIPTPEEGKSVTPLAEVQIAWKATFDPEDGCLGVNAQLTSNSYILSKDCHLTGGYAFYRWFSGDHAGDFVQTLGGYHPGFVVPPHYPVVPRLAFLWKVSSELTIKGDAYHALTGSTLMAGGHLEVNFDAGDLKAWIKLGADFLISWKPYHYDASVYVDVGVSYTFDVNLLFTHIRVTISVDVGADLHLWGPDFSGTAHIHLWIISFSISFGAGASQKPEAIDWSTFQKSFLPAEKVCSISVKDGLVRTLEGKTGEDGLERWIINPKHFSLVVSSAVPFKGASIAQQDFNETTRKWEIKSVPPPVKIELAVPSFGIGSMEVIPADLDSTIAITVTRDGVPADEEFGYALIQRRVPAGLWGESLTPDINGNTFIEDVPTGFEITPSKQPDPGVTSTIALSKFKFAFSYFPKDEGFPDKSGYAYSWEPAASFALSDLEEQGIEDGIEDKPLTDAQLKALDVARRKAVSESVDNNSSRDSLMTALKVTVDINVTGTVAQDFLRAPKIGTFSG